MTDNNTRDIHIETKTCPNCGTTEMRIKQFANWIHLDIPLIDALIANLEDCRKDIVEHKQGSQVKP